MEANQPVLVVPGISVVIPVHNKVQHVGACLDSVIEAAQRHGNVDVVIVDHQSSDGSRAIVERHRGVARIVELEGGNIAAVRNYGASLTRGRLISFLDCDCVVAPDYFTALADVFRASGAGAAGCEVDVPTDAHWSEPVWHRLHVIRDDGPRHYINSANFAVRRDVFDAVHGFDEALVTGEDTDICTRIRSAGFTIFESHRLRAVHLDNPKSLGAFYRKEVWRGLGAFSGTLRTHANKATMMVFAHLAFVAIGLAALLVAIALRSWLWFLIAAALMLAAPVITIAYRFAETRRLTNPAAALLLYVVYYFARGNALLRTLASSNNPQSARSKATVPNANNGPLDTVRHPTAARQGGAERS
jgi:glycosyltransferase involved in cell wall biosynthesis